MAVMVVVGFEVVDIHQQHEVLASVRPGKVLQPALQPATVIQAGERVHHAKIGQGFALLQQFGKQLLGETVIAPLKNMMDTNGDHRQREKIGHSQPVFGRAKPQAGYKGGK